jgi:hypothetical protein
MATKDNTLIWVVVIVGAWWYFKNNGMGFNPTQASGELTGNPKPSTYSGQPVQTISGTWHL